MCSSDLGAEDMKRRQFITLLSGAAIWPLVARAQQVAIPIIGFLSGRSSHTDAPLLTTFRQSLNESGFAEGQNVAFEYHTVDGQYDLFPALAAELVRRQVAIIVVFGSDMGSASGKSGDCSHSNRIRHGRGPGRIRYCLQPCPPGRQHHRCHLIFEFAWTKAAGTPA